MKREELLVNAKPILFNTEMVRAILEDRKTVTRRVIKVDGKDFVGFVTYSSIKKHKGHAAFGEGSRNDIAHMKINEYIRPIYKPGDILYVRETYRDVIVGLVGFDGEAMWTDDVIEYKASQEEFEKKYEGLIGEYSKWHPSIHMPKSAARIFLKVTSVRVERLQCINGQGRHDDILKEGYPFGMKIEQPPILMFEKLWNSTIKKQDLDSYGWYANPYVWVIEFERVKYE